MDPEEMTAGVRQLLEPKLRGLVREHLTALCREQASGTAREPNSLTRSVCAEARCHPDFLSDILAEAAIEAIASRGVAAGMDGSVTGQS